ncbi:FMN-binding negative transcriptional regulator [Puia sp.]|jgi:transcriptional regulator|uniref:FMN-binding negative transcriptional regulator n=1 Tax=Puia sp. TaxID=2045100 RepID=UPI002F404402
MYIPRRYEEKDTEKIHAFLRENSFAILISVHDGRPVGTHIPLQLETGVDGKDCLLGHISRGNDQKYSLTAGAKVLAIFPGPHAYVSPRWYTELKVPTWNYISVHIYGTVTLIEGEELRAALSRLIDTYEHPLPQPVHIDEIPHHELQADLRGIVGFRIAIDEIQAAYKLSQNRDPQSYHQVIDHLSTGDEASRAVAAEMQKRKL